MYLTPFLLEFGSWHWSEYWHAETADPELQNCYEATSDPTTPEEFERGFLTLLRSEGAIARSIALDYFDRAEMTERYVGGNPLEAHWDEVLRVGRKLLHEPPSPAGESTFEGASHASALSMLLRGSYLGEEDGDRAAGPGPNLPGPAGPSRADETVRTDRDVIVDILKRMPADELMEHALEAADMLLESQTEEPSGDQPGDDDRDHQADHGADHDADGGATRDPELAALTARVRRCRKRLDEIQALRSVSTGDGGYVPSGVPSDMSADEATATLVEATNDDEWRVRQEAAAALASGRNFYAHRSLLERLVDAWTEDERSAAADEVREALSDGPHSLYWEGSEVGSALPTDAELRAAHRELRSPTGEASHREAFRTLLHSGSPVAVGVALDHFHSTEGLTRFGLDDQEHAPEALATAREILNQPPSAAALSPRTGAGANHAGALNIMLELAGPGDAQRIANALRSDDAPLVRQRAVQAAWACLERWETPDEQVVAALEELAFDTSEDLDLRVLAIGALFNLSTPQVTAVLLRAVRSAELPIQAEAAVCLSTEHLIDEHQGLLRDLLASWPQDMGDYEPGARIVRSALETRDAEVGSR